MSIDLALPEFLPKSSARVESQPARLALWLDRLPGDPVERAAEMAGSLSTFNRTPLSSKSRREFGELFQARAQPLWVPLEKALAAASHPLVGESLETARAAIALASELNIACKRALADEVDRRFGGGRDLPLLVRRCQMAAGRTLAICYQAYTPVPEGTWHDLHAIYQLAEQRGFAKGAAAGHLSPEAAYVQTLLLGLANPYGLLPGQLPLVLDFIVEHGSAAVLSAETPVHRHSKAVSIVPVGYDFPPFSANKGGSAEGQPMYLLTFDLAFRMQERMRAIERGAPLPAAIGSGVRARRRYAALLRKLMREWGDPPVRHLNRLASGTEVAACFGMSLVWQLTRALQPRPGSDTEASGVTSALRRCRVVNQTPGGYGLRLPGAAAESIAIRVGELIGIRSREPDRWAVAAVRWFRNALADQGVELGCEVLSTQAEAISGRGEDAGSGRALPGLHLDADRTHAATLLLVSGAFGSEDGVLVQRGGHTLTVVLTRLIEQTPAFERYEYVAVP